MGQSPLPWNLSSPVTTRWSVAPDPPTGPRKTHSALFRIKNCEDFIVFNSHHKTNCLMYVTKIRCSATHHNNLNLPTLKSILIIHSSANLTNMESVSVRDCTCNNMAGHESTLHRTHGVGWPHAALWSVSTVNNGFATNVLWKAVRLQRQQFEKGLELF